VGVIPCWFNSSPGHQRRPALAGLRRVQEARELLRLRLGLKVVGMFLALFQELGTAEAGQRTLNRMCTKCIIILSDS
jgi:hypothetical protein